MNIDVLKQELLKEMEKQGITDKAEVDSEMTKLEALFDKIKKQEKEVARAVKKNKFNPVAHAYEKELHEELARLNRDFAEMGPITQQSVHMLQEARARVAEDVKRKYANNEGDAAQRVLTAIGELDRMHGRLPQKRVNITPEEFENCYTMVPESGELSLAQVRSTEEKLKKYQETKAKAEKNK